MIRFKVIKGSHLLLAISMLILLAVIAFIMLQGGFSAEQEAVSPVAIVQNVSPQEAKAITVFASNASSSSMLRIEIIPDTAVPEAQTQTSGNILIYHTHTHEAYEQEADESYAALEAWRTDDTSHNVVHLGSVLAEELRNLGYTVTHDTTDHEQDSLSDAYVRSLKTLESYSDSFDLCIDLHRDAYVEGLLPCIANGEMEYAQLMCLVGRGDAYPESEKPDYERNLHFAQQLTTALNREIPNICRNVTIKTGRYNQHIGQISLLIEVGHNKNTLRQALNSIPPLARQIDSILSRQ